MTTERDYDIIVVGGGPAGTAFARRIVDLEPSTQVLIIERQRHPRNKVCGDAVEGCGLKLLDEIFPGVRSRVEARATHTSCTVAYPTGSVFTLDNDPLQIIARSELDAALWDALPGSVETLQEARVTELLRRGDRLVGVALQQDGQRREIRGRLIVGADGSRSSVRRLVSGSRDSAPGRLGVRQYFRDIPDPQREGTLIYADLDHEGYFWAFPFQRDGCRWANVGWWSFGAPGARARARYEACLEHPEVRRYLGQGQPQGKPQGYPINTALLQRGRMALSGPVCGPGYILLGDAAGLAHPLTGGGVPIALFSGKLAAELVAQELPDDQRAARYEEALLDFGTQHFDLPGFDLALKRPCSMSRPKRAVFMLVLRALSRLDRTRRRLMVT